MAIYTKRGDRGETSLYDEGSSQKIRVPKDSQRIKAIGSVDELNSFLGIVVSVLTDKHKSEIKNIQRDLFQVGSILAGAKLNFPKSKTKRLERKIDDFENNLPILKSFILPGGSLVGANLHYARTLVRRAERELVALDREETVKSEILSYINRLSDYLFMLARVVNRESNVSEDPWQGSKK